MSSLTRVLITGVVLVMACWVQFDRGQISGTVFDGSLRTVAGAELAATHIATGQRYATTSRENGSG